MFMIARSIKRKSPYAIKSALPICLDDVRLPEGPGFQLKLAIIFASVHTNRFRW